MEKGTRIQKVLSDQGIVSRRKAEDLIRQGKIEVNGRPASIGQKINPVKDLITIEGKKIGFVKNSHKYYVMLNKPRGYVTTMSDELGRKCVAELMEDLPERVYPIGRLDKDSEGLLLLTNDGDFANLIMHPSHHVSKTYRVTVRPSISDAQTVQLSTGVVIDGKKTSPAHVTVLEKVPGRVVLQIVIYEGRNRQVRKMCEEVGLEVARLKRTSVGPVKLGMLAPGKWRELKPGEVGMLRNAVKTASGAPELLNDMDEDDRFAQKKKKSAPAPKPTKNERQARGADKFRKDEPKGKGRSNFGKFPNEKKTSSTGKRFDAGKKDYRGKSSQGKKTYTRKG